jgi:phage major head subunit gpT-like protein
MIAMMGIQAKALPDDLVRTAIRAGEATVCYDGQYFFDNDHPVDMANAGLGVQSNLYTATPLTADNYAAMRAAMMAWKGEDGRPLTTMPTLLVVPPQLEVVAKRIINADLVANAAGTAAVSNVLKGSAEVLVVAEFADAPLDWYLIDDSKPIKPFVYQDREAPTFTYLTDPTSDNVFNKKEYVYGVDARGQAGYALWFLALKAKG